MVIPDILIRISSMQHLLSGLNLILVSLGQISAFKLYLSRKKGESSFCVKSIFEFVIRPGASFLST